ncbi:hypothetical protein [Antribacter gilvus]|uniref:hypothetical protein n=1 Tax=Antribacter gilvus TaxID=2304675 RepID=UPI000F7698AD|nr:hypothetical protein [Antribacter gilvus]
MDPDDVDEHDTPAEVDAAFRTLRRVAITHFLLFLAVVTGVPALSLTLGWWSDARIEGGLSPGFAMAAFGLYAFFLVVGLAAATLSNAVESRMLGGDHPGADGADRHEDQQ